MFDTLKSIWAGLAGRLNAHPEARRLVWPLLIVYLFGWLATAFVVWVAQPTYLSLLTSLPGSEHMAWAFSIGLALCIYFFTAYVAGYAVERWLSVPVEHRNYSPIGVRIFGAALALFGGVDLFMQTQGAVVHGENAAGEKVVYAYTDETLTNRMAENRAKVAEIRTGKTGRGEYGWPDLDGQYRLNKKGQKEVARLEAEISKDADLDRMQREATRAGVEQTNTRKDEIKGRVSGVLSYASWGVYAVLLILCVIQGYIVENIQAALLEMGYVEERPSRQQWNYAPLSRGAAGLVTAEDGRRPAGYKIETQDNAMHTPHALHGTCEHCGTGYTKRTTWQKFCSEPCRVAKWEAENPGKKAKARNA